MMTLKEYLAAPRSEGWKAHHQYYGEIVAEAGLRVPPNLLARVKGALAEGDKYLNSIPLAVWDHMPKPGALVKAFRDRGDYLTPAGFVCAWKEAARRQAEE